MTEHIDLRWHIYGAVDETWGYSRVAVTNAVLAVIRDNQQLVDDYLKELAEAKRAEH